MSLEAAFWKGFTEIAAMSGCQTSPPRSTRALTREPGKFAGVRYLATPISADTPQSGARKLEGILRTIAQATEGNRNQILFWASCRLAEMAAVGLLSRDTAMALAIEAATRSGLSRLEAQRTVLSAFRS